MLFILLDVTVFVSPGRFLLDLNFCGLWHSDYFVDGKPESVCARLAP